MKTDLYMTPDHPDAFVDFPSPKASEKYANESYMLRAGYTQECLQCKGHGGWNLKLNAYSLYKMKNTKANRHMYAHSRCVCGNCSGWGLTEPCDHVQVWGPDQGTLVGRA